MAASNDRRPRPTFVIIGAQKCATRWLRMNLGKHPDIYTARSELAFWNTEKRVERLGLDWYRDQFDGWKGEPIVGEATPGYMIWRHHPARVAKRMKDAIPDARLIALLRNPIDRAQSAMLHHIRRERIPEGSRLLDVVLEHRPPEHDWFCLVSGGWYAASLEPFLDRFGDRLLVLFQEDVSADPVRPYETALRHVGADPAFVPKDLARVVFSNQKGRSGKKSPLPAEDREQLWDFFRDDVARLERLLGVDLSRWEPTPPTLEPA